MVHAPPAALLQAHPCGRQFGALLRNGRGSFLVRGRGVATEWWRRCMVLEGAWVRATKVLGAARVARTRASNLGIARPSDSAASPPRTGPPGDPGACARCGRTCGACARRGSGSVRPISASQSSGLDEHPRSLRFSRWRSRISLSRADLAQWRAESVRHCEMRLRRIEKRSASQRRRGVDGHS